MKPITIAFVGIVLLFLIACGDYIHDMEDGELKKLPEVRITVPGAFEKNAIGPEASRPIPEADYRYNDSNSVFVSKTGSPANPGTQKSPKSTLLDAINDCTYARRRVVVLDSEAYHQKLDGFNKEFFEGLYGLGIEIGF